eukprot:CAMPEP_0177588088 /NCGR_PEP_ID=MMETSP0419_2-20121207/6029_1 /TAXON_ID=582737 /ORGANISM="Tetraselmis sp., Strain GSL018" /LENGTH=30 /DNA_ID= /DNA_START= /DNA_END= /DNA_ORIENTATION=
MKAVEDKAAEKDPVKPLEPAIDSCQGLSLA